MLVTVVEEITPGILVIWPLWENAHDARDRMQKLWVEETITIDESGCTTWEFGCKM